MHNKFTNNLLNLKGIKVKKVEHSDSWVKIFITTNPSEHICPACSNCSMCSIRFICSLCSICFICFHFSILVNIFVFRREFRAS